MVKIKHDWFSCNINFASFRSFEGKYQKKVRLMYFFQYFKGIHVFTSTYIQLFVKSKGLFKYQEAKNSFFLKLSTIVSINWHLVIWGQVLHHQIFSYDLFWPLFHAFLILGRVFFIAVFFTVFLKIGWEWF